MLLLHYIKLVVLHTYILIYTRVRGINKQDGAIRDLDIT